MPGEVDAEHLVGLALVPVGAGVDRHPRLDAAVLVGDVGLDRDADVQRGAGHAGRTPGSGCRRRCSPGGSRCRARAAARSGRPRPVPNGDGSQSMADRKPKYLQPDGVAQGQAGLAPRLGGDPDPQVVARLDAACRRVRRRARERICVDEPLAQPVAGHARASRSATSAVGHSTSGPTADDDRLAVVDRLRRPRRASVAPMSSCWMRSCSRTMPSSSASGRGGQPGT